MLDRSSQSWLPTQALALRAFEWKPGFTHAAQHQPASGDTDRQLTTVMHHTSDVDYDVNKDNNIGCWPWVGRPTLMGWSPGLSDQVTTPKAAFTPGHVLPGTCIPDEQRVSGCIYVDGYISTDTSCSFWDICRLGDIITIHLCQGRLVSLCIQQQTGDNFVADTRYMSTATSGYNLYPATCVLV